MVHVSLIWIYSDPMGLNPGTLPHPRYHHVANTRNASFCLDFRSYYNVSTNFCATWKSPKSTAKGGDGENPGDSATRLSLGPSPVHSASAKKPVNAPI